MPSLADEERRRRVQVHELGVEHVVLDAPHHRGRAQVVGEPVHVETEVPGVAAQVVGRQPILVREERAGHVEEAALHGGRLDGLRGLLRVGVHHLERKVTEHPPHVVAEVVAHRVDRARRPAAERALEVAVLDDRERCVGPTGEVVALHVDRTREPCADGHGRPHSVGHGEDRPAERERDDGCREHAHAREILCLGVLDRESHDEERDGEADARERRAAGDAGHRQARGQAAEAEPQHERGRTGDADELADDEARHDAPRER